MNVGFIGAGKVGGALGRYFVAHDIPVTGYYDVCPPAAQRAAQHTATATFPDAASLAASSDTILLTVPDSVITPAWHTLRDACAEAGALEGKVICHCSGCMPARAIDDAASCGAHAASAHPLLAVSDPLMNLGVLEGAHITLEGDATAVDALRGLLASLPNPLHAINEGDKVRYHAAAVLASNLVLAPLAAAERLMASCGFDEHDAREALEPLVRGNVDAFCSRGAVGALTGPVERNDATTVEGHLRALDAHDPATARLYRVLTAALVGIAQAKHPDRDYAPLAGTLEPGAAAPADASAASPSEPDPSAAATTASPTGADPAASTPANVAAAAAPSAAASPSGSASTPAPSSASADTHPTPTTR
ncbi:MULTISPECIES: Rossmann-like and DUF2520 domain-containing protein [unclassified Adlercreutzia]|uniref:Rossmann-like and DUF2520 domain-containing protein n=1 Tax=unclassified Adlercreutzia TaxID=2636013 RepID=UPI0013ED05FC|nr:MULTISPECIES: Rossmann-like and DUF2520 domain-containing protein [unclassified Adlercreutzia]